MMEDSFLSDEEEVEDLKTMNRIIEDLSKINK